MADPTNASAPARLGPIERTVLAAIPLAMGIAYLCVAIALPDPTNVHALPPRVFPLIIGTAMVLIGLAIGLGVIVRFRGIDKAPGADDEVDDWLDVGVTVAALVVMVFGMELLGFAVTAAAVVMVLSTFVARRRWVRNAIAAVVFAGVAQYVFGTLLTVRLPGGILGFWL
jgi:putative tricarboxylic transport membrane protein